MNDKTALIAGATGLVGSNLLHILLESKEYSRVIAIVRTPLHYKHPKLTEKMVDFDHLDEVEEYFEVDDVFCCLGTTIKKAKTKEAMLKVDQEYPLKIATLASEKGAKQFLIVSAMGADSNSSIWYSKMKGDLEEALTHIPFVSISIARPSLLLGSRKEFRLGESVGAFFMKMFSFIMRGPLLKYKAINGEAVASALYKIAQKENEGITIYSSRQLQEES